MTVLIKYTVEVEKKAHFHSLTLCLIYHGKQAHLVKANGQRYIFFNFFQIINAMMPLRYTKHVCCMEKYS